MSALKVVPVTFEQLVGESAPVVYARVADVRGQWTSDRQGIDSVVTLDYFKGDLGLAVAMRLPGGEGGGLRQMPPGAPSVREGDLVVVFLKARGPALLSPVGLGQGVLHVTRDPRTGVMTVAPPTLKESAIGRVIRGAADRRALTLEALADASVSGVSTVRQAHLPGEASADAPPAAELAGSVSTRAESCLRRHGRSLP